MEQIFGHAFPKSRPEWLFNSKGNRSELDGYCSELKLAFEHHGEQHYQIHNLYSKTQDKLNERQHEDRYKAHVCLENGVKIVVIPEIFSLTTLDGVINVIENECIEKKIKLPLSFDRNVHVDLKRAYSTNDAKIAIEELRAIALKSGGKCLSTTYERSSTKMSWECQNGHLFDARPNDIKRGVWCRKCSGLHPLSIKEMKLLAEKKGGTCLSSEYINAHTRLKWRCSEGHIWEAIANSIKHNNRWCPHCAGNARLTIEVLKRIAEEKGGKCLSESYSDNKKPLLWQCALGHTWEASADKVKNRGQWCARCS